ncbi:RimJ/RimL family protein N-acetyltransferase [Bacillus oleivorans]|uniref:RimJ/RimL family protein N-acetyltransferase n=1 Tax=Bacillus oleivorans TaxID=1448271 RepID=A0A285D552_9BACI|nr:GNAT family protein [Bacillus oleivorans]SNX74920.1 RimJ/RimL family protein N-acetyltransferase [Bacillus oleivorans]
MKIRDAVIEDAPHLVNLIKEVEESNFMLFGPGERQTTAEQLLHRIESMTQDETSTIIVGEADDRTLAGYLMAIGGNPTRARHKVYLVVGVSGKFRGKGVGTQLFLRLEEWSRTKNIHRLELTVLTHNERAISLYKKMGFEIEGTKRDSLFIDGIYRDEYYMSKLIRDY